MPDLSTAAPEPQPVAGPLTAAAIFLVLTINDGAENATRVRETIADIGDLVRAVGFRSLDGDLTCAVGIGSAAWDRIGTGTRPAQLHDFVALAGAKHSAPATPGDLLFHIRAERVDLCFEFERLLLANLGAATTVADETQTFRYFDTRDLLGFVDGTENPTGQQRLDAVFIDDAEPELAGGTYAIVQKYTHDLAGWQALSTETQELIMGRTKLDDVELGDDVQPPDSHVALNTIEGADGVKHDILRGNMPFGMPGSGEVGLYYVGYCKDMWVIEKMLVNMFIGDPPGSYDKVLDFSTAITGTNFFIPSRDLLESLADLDDDAGEPDDARPVLPLTPAPISASATGDDSLHIGSLKGEYGHE